MPYAGTVRGVEYCRHCGKTTDEVGKLSQRGKCTRCAAHNMESAPEEMMNGTGPVGEKWLRNIRRGVEQTAARSNTPHRD